MSIHAFVADTFRKAGAPVVLVNVGFAKDFQRRLETACRSPFAMPPGGFPENFSDLLDGLAKLATFSSPSANGAAFMEQSWICSCAAAVSRQSFWGAVRNGHRSRVNGHDRRGEHGYAIVLVEDATSACPLRCTTLPSAISFQGSAESSKVLN